MSATEEIKDGAKKHAETNGVICLGLPRRGLAQLKFNEDDFPFTVDVTQVSDEWHIVDSEFRDKERKLLPGKLAEWRKAKTDYVQSVVNDAYAKVKEQNPTGDVRVPNVTRYEAEGFMHKIEEEVAELFGFFYPKDAPPSSSSESREPEQRINFSQ